MNTTIEGNGSKRVFIREAVPGDAQAIARVHIDAWRSSYSGIVPDEHLSGLSYERLGQRWAESLSRLDKGEIVFVLVDTEVGVVGFSQAGPSSDPDSGYDAELHMIYLDPQYLGLGLGKSLLLRVIEWLEMAGMHSLVLWVLAENPSRASYDHLGGQTIVERQREIGGKTLTEVAYAWSDFGAVSLPRRRI
jgi:GNAT superfamily N-acetyltransferase